MWAAGWSVVVVMMVMCHQLSSGMICDEKTNR